MRLIVREIIEYAVEIPDKELFEQFGVHPDEVEADMGRHASDFEGLGQTLLQGLKSGGGVDRSHLGYDLELELFDGSFTDATLLDWNTNKPTADSAEPGSVNK